MLEVIVFSLFRQTLELSLFQNSLSWSIMNLIEFTLIISKV